MFENLELQPPDAIIGIMAMFRADPAPRKVDLSVGVFQDETGRTPVLACVKRAERRIIEAQDTKSYVAIAGNPGFNEAMETLLFGAGHPALEAGRISSVQTPGGSGGLSVLGHVIAPARPTATVWLSTPSWPNHLPLLRLAGLTLAHYPYYDFDRHRVDFDGMVETFAKLGPDDVVLLHGCCHNPCGADLTREQWDALADLFADRRIVPFVDIAYQGLAEDLDKDAYGARHHGRAGGRSPGGRVVLEESRLVPGASGPLQASSPGMPTRPGPLGPTLRRWAVGSTQCLPTMAPPSSVASCTMRS